MFVKFGTETNIFTLTAICRYFLTYGQLPSPNALSSSIFLLVFYFRSKMAPFIAPYRHLFGFNLKIWLIHSSAKGLVMKMKIRDLPEFLIAPEDGAVLVVAWPISCSFTKQALTPLYSSRSWYDSLFSIRVQKRESREKLEIWQYFWMTTKLIYRTQSKISSKDKIW